METSLSKEIKVGIFTVIGILLFCLSIIMLGGNRVFTSSYPLKVRFPQVQGLAVGSVVSLTGVQIGNIRSINFLEGSTDVEVIISVNQSMRARITEGSKASVKTQGALGDKYIYVEPGPASAPPLADNGLLETDRTPDFLDLIASKGAEMGEITSVIKEVRVLFENINKDGKSAKLFTNLVTASDEFSQTMREARETFRLMKNETFVPMASIMKKVDRGDGTLGALVNDPSLHNRISNFFGETPRNKFLKPMIRDSIQTNESKK
jgi:phospholipid/cholesterol/gamma-HCH transport system substrate-binding protein